MTIDELLDRDRLAIGEAAFAGRVVELGHCRGAERAPGAGGVAGLENDGESRTGR
jgi:hypothetical protein